MSGLAPFFLESNRGFHPEMSLSFLVGVGQMVEGDYIRYEGRFGPRDFLDGQGLDEHLEELQHLLVRTGFPRRSTQKIRNELLRIRSGWNRVCELKLIEKDLRGIPLDTDSRVIRFTRKEYDWWAEVFDVIVD